MSLIFIRHSQINQFDYSWRGEVDSRQDQSGEGLDLFLKSPIDQDHCQRVVIVSDQRKVFR